MAVLYVVAAAIRDADGKVYSLPPPARHHTIIRHYHPLLKCSIGDNQGFVLSDGRYARRAAAMTVARRAGQLLPDGRRLRENPNSNELYSEDVW